MGRWGGGSKVGAASSHSPLQGATLYQIAWTNQGINIFTLSSRQYPHCCMRVHLCAWHTLNYKIITFLLSFPLALEPKPRNTTSIFFLKKILLFLLHLAGKVRKCTHTERLLKLTVLYTITYLVTPTFAANDCLSFTLLRISPFQPCISAVITIHTDFLPLRFRIRQCCVRAVCKVQRQNATSETRGNGWGSGN